MGLISSCLWSLRIFPSLPGLRLTIFICDVSSALLQLVSQWLNFPYPRPHAFLYGRKNTNPGEKIRTHDFRTSRCTGYLIDHSGDEGTWKRRTSEVTLLGLADQPKDPRTGARRTETAVVARRVDASHGIPLEHILSLLYVPCVLFLICFFPLHYQQWHSVSLHIYLICITFLILFFRGGGGVRALPDLLVLFVFPFRQSSFSGWQPMTESEKTTKTTKTTTTTTRVDIPMSETKTVAWSFFFSFLAPRGGTCHRHLGRYARECLYYTIQGYTRPD